MSEQKKSTRTAFIEAITKMGMNNKDIVTIAADSQSRYGDFVKEFPERSFNVGIAEQTMIGVAAGLALSGKIPVVTSYANFLTFRAIEQIRVDIATENLNVKLVGTDTGFSSAWLGFTHLALEDMASIRAIPNIVIIDPADAVEAYEAACAMFEYKGPVYLRLRGRKEEPVLTIPRQSFKIGKGQILKEGTDVALIACGSSVYESLRAADLLTSRGIDAAVINMATIRPLDEELVIEMAENTKKVVTVETHNITGGLGSAVGELMAEKLPGAHLLRLGIKDRFGTAGSEDMLKKEFKLDGEGIAENVERFLNGL
jgi:transketolase